MSMPLVMLFPRIWFRSLQSGTANGWLTRSL